MITKMLMEFSCMSYKGMVVFKDYLVEVTQYLLSVNDIEREEAQGYLLVLWENIANSEYKLIKTNNHGESLDFIGTYGL